MSPFLYIAHFDKEKKLDPEKGKRATVTSLLASYVYVGASMQRSALSKQQCRHLVHLRVRRQLCHSHGGSLYVNEEPRHALDSATVSGPPRYPHRFVHAVGCCSFHSQE